MAGENVGAVLLKPCSTGRCRLQGSLLALIWELVQGLAGLKLPCAGGWSLAGTSICCRRGGTKVRLLGASGCCTGGMHISPLPTFCSAS